MFRSILCASVLSLAGTASAQATSASVSPGQRGDANHDGVVSRDEFNAMPARGVDRMDASGDGVLEPDEMPWARQHAQQRLGRASH